MSLTTSAHWMYNAGGGFYGTEIDQSLRVAYGDNPELSRTNSSAPTNNSKGTLSFWMKRGLIGSGTGNNQYIIHTGSGTSNDTHMDLKIETGDILSIGAYSNTPITGTPKLRDVSSWYHIVVKFDSTSATASERQIKVYINGVEMAGTKGPVAQNQKFPWINQSQEINIFRHVSVNRPYDGYIAEMHLIDGQALDPTSFGETKSGIWIPKKYSGSYGTNGFHLEFADNASDSSGNGNNWTANNISASDYVLDSPTNNFATHNNLASLGGMTFFEGNTKVRHADIAAYNHARSTMGMTSGKWYWEWYNSGSSGDAPNLLSGIVNDNVPVSTSNGYVGQNTNSYGWNGTNGARYYNGSNIGTIAIPTGDSSGIYMVAYDADSGKLYFGKNGTWANSGNPSAGTGALFTGIDTDTTWYPAGYTINNDAGRWRDVVVNHGQDSTFAGNKTAGGNTDSNGVGDFYYTPPSGFVALCSANLPTGAIDPVNDETPEDYFNTVLFDTQSGSYPKSITGVGFQPDLVWAKSRNQAYPHYLFDVVRGTGVTHLSSNSTAAEGWDGTTDLDSFDTDGFTIGAGDGIGYTNGVAWNWKANGAGISNTDGSIASTVSVGATSQQNWFSIVNYTGAGSVGTVGHGLGVTPDMYIVKNRNQTGDWCVYHKDMNPNPEQYYMLLNLTNSPIDNNTIWNDTAPTSTTFSIGSYLYGNNINYIAYCFANAEGLCKVGSYTGNGSTDGTFIYTGFRPALWLVKSSSVSGEPWMLMDNTRDSYNLNDAQLQAQDPRAESNDGNGIDFLSNGIKIRSNIGNWGTNGVTYIYMAIAEQPFKYANAR